MTVRWIKSIVACLIAVGPLAAAEPDKDYSQLPPDPSEFAQKLANSKITLAEAVAAAEKRVDGKATRAVVRYADGKLLLIIDVEAPGLTATVQIDPATGTVADTKPDSAADVALTEAITKAEKESGGHATEAMIELQDEAKTITVEVVGKGLHKKVKIDPAKGDVTGSEELSLSRFPGDPVQGEPVKTESGLMYYDIKPGDGEPVPSADKWVEVHYSGWLVDGTEFDSSVKRGQPAKFPLNRVIPGWTEGVGSMKVGGKRKLIVPYKQAYGERGRPPIIPAKATLIFDVELLSVQDAPPAPAFRPQQRPTTTRPAAARTTTPPAGRSGLRARTQPASQ